MLMQIHSDTIGVAKSALNPPKSSFMPQIYRQGAKQALNQPHGLFLIRQGCLASSGASIP
ncbi:unnamed protein product [Eruca vesicaria subsp. sativa]|uniref:Uncharacterized protein n=1 Tax=Eruca vesicaria subsp. sativa TaxID=29727 RepID=A0ABC8L5C0_ERUVS|nr:unnamed protein product [Eruca vesicaria subsp. sativa]